MGVAWAEAMKVQAKHPDVKIVYENKGFEQIRQTTQMILNSDEAPDVMESTRKRHRRNAFKQGLLPT